MEGPPKPPDDANAETVLRRSGEPSDLGATRIAGEALPLSAEVPSGRIGRYELRAMLGKGGMGVVYRAFDTQLKRDVALKLLRLQPGEAGEMLQRFRLEAEAAAKLRHPNLVALFDFGTENGQPFLTMELVEGGSLARLLAQRGGKLPPNEAMRLVRDVARGLACAHEKGIVHRDLKPENILLDGDAPKISDFGLAQSAGRPADARLTVHGSILGTPVYMAPEQAEGDLDRVDARSDVYALGAVLYEAASGRPAYAGKDPMAVILDKIANDPPPPKGLGRDLETIILKSMAREPERRYASAKELAEDLDRCLSGAAILARPESGFESLLRRLRRRRDLTAASALVVICLAIAGGLALNARSERRRQKQLEEEALVLVRSVAETNLDASLALRRNGIPVAQQERFLKRVEGPAQNAMARGPNSPEPHYLLGQMHRALQQFDLALVEQEHAIAKDPAFAPARFERALLDFRRLEKRLTELRATWARDEGRRLAQEGKLDKGAALPPPPSDAELAAGDADASALLSRIAGDIAALERAQPPSAETLRGLLLLHGATEAERADGASRVERAVATDPTLVEAHEALARAAQARDEFDEARHFYARGLAADAGFIPFLLGRASVAENEAERATRFGANPLDAYNAAEADLTRALELDPALAEARLARGRILCLRADHLAGTGQDPKPDFQAALADLTAAPPTAETLLARGLLHSTWGHWHLDRGDDPQDRFRLAVADFDASLALAPLTAAWTARADARRTWGRFLKNNGKDPRELYLAALEDYTRALERDPRFADLWISRSAARQALSVYRRVSGDPSWKPLLEEARADLNHALSLTPKSTWIRGLRAEADILLAGCLVQDGDEPGEVFARMIADLDALLAEQSSADTLIQRASARTQWAEYLDGLGREGAAELIALAHKDLDAAVPESGGRFDYGLELGRLELLEAKRGDPEIHLDRARKALRMTLDLNSNTTEAWMRLGLVGTLEGCLREARGQNPGPIWDAAEADFNRALEINPKWEQVWLGRGKLWVAQAMVGTFGPPPEQAPRYALADLRQVVTVNPNYVDGWVALGEAKRRFDRDGSLLAEARVHLDRAVELGPNHAGAHLERARVRLALGDRAGAEADLARVVERAPAWAGLCRDVLAGADGN